MKKLGNNKNVLGMIGCSKVNSPRCLVLEYMEYGDLLRYLREKRTKVNCIPLLGGVPILRKSEIYLFFYATFLTILIIGCLSAYLHSKSKIYQLNSLSSTSLPKFSIVFEKNIFQS